MEENNIITVSSGDYILARNLDTNEFWAWRYRFPLAAGVTYYHYDEVGIKPHTFFEAYTAIKNEEAKKWLESQVIAN